MVSFLGSNNSEITASLYGALEKLFAIRDSLRDASADADDDMTRFTPGDGISIGQFYGATSYEARLRQKVDTLINEDGGVPHGVLELLPQFTRALQFHHWKFFDWVEEGVASAPAEDISHLTTRLKQLGHSLRD